MAEFILNQQSSHRSSDHDALAHGEPEKSTACPS
jgi:hypothetical protein